MKCSRCGCTCNAVTDMSRGILASQRAVSDCCRDEIIMEIKQMDDWKELDKKQIPTDILEAAYEFQVKTDVYGWTESECGIIDILAKLRNGYVKYRYRLKPLESCRMTEGMFQYLLRFSEIPFRQVDGVYYSVDDNRKVEIIGDGE